MTSNHVLYKEGYKYQLADDFMIQLENIYPPVRIDAEYLMLSVEGQLIIKKGYAWDGPSGPTIDTKNTLRGSLVHDALYQLMREELLEEEWRDEADKELRRICRLDGMSWLRAKVWERMVNWFAAKCASPSHKKPVLSAP